MIVTFTRHFPPYNPGESAGFDDVTGRRFIEHGIAQAVVTPGDAVQKENSDAPPPDDPKPAGRRTVTK